VVFEALTLQTAYKTLVKQPKNPHHAALVVYGCEVHSVEASGAVNDDILPDFGAIDTPVVGCPSGQSTRDACCAKLTVIQFYSPGSLSSNV
jgi:hypothetical protein